MTSSERVLVTGGCGFVGAELARNLELHGCETFVLDDLSRGSVASLSGRTRAHFQKIDVRDFDNVVRMVREVQPNRVYHLAAIHFIPECDAQPERAYSVNVLGTVNVLEAVRREVPDARVVLASTGAVYAISDEPLSVAHSVVEPTDAYSFSKLAAENAVNFYRAKYSLDLRIARLFNVYGPGETNPHLIPYLIEQIRAGVSEIPLGNTRPRRDYVEVSDVAAGLRAIMSATDVHVPVNLGTGTEWSVDAVLSVLSDLVGRPLVARVDPARLRQSDRLSQVALAEETFGSVGWRAKVTLRNGLTTLLAHENLVTPRG